MDVDWNAELLDQLEWHWQHQLRPRLDGLTDHEYLWQPVPGCWTLRRRGENSTLNSADADAFAMDYTEVLEGPAPVTTIAWRLAHLIDVFGIPTVPHFNGPRANDPVGNYSGTAEQALRQLDEGHDAWVDDLRRLGTAGLTRPQMDIAPPQYANAPMAKRVMHIHREVIHHGAEICLLRDLYLWNKNDKDL
jgi:hypothetical protein